MDLGKVMTFGFVIVVLFTMFCALVSYTLPLYMKLEVQKIGKAYKTEMRAQVGLTDEQIDELTTLLENKGMENVVVTASKVGTVKFGELLSFEMEMDYPISTYSIFSRTTTYLNIDYHDQFRNLKVEE